MVNCRILMVFVIACSWCFAEGGIPFQKMHYTLTNEPIDVVIPCTEKDIETLDLCIQGIRENGVNVRRVIVISDRPYTEQAEWFDEADFPFSKYDIAHVIFQEKSLEEYFVDAPRSRFGWIFQQLLKLYAPFVIPEISSNVLVLDADTIFLSQTHFLGPDGGGLYNVGTEYHVPYFEHMTRLLPGLTKVYSSHSGISHHMLFQKNVLQELLLLIEEFHYRDAWEAICRCIDKKHLFGSSLSEYEIYFNFIFTTSDQMSLRPLKWANITDLTLLEHYRAQGYHFVSCHAWSRG